MCSEPRTLMESAFGGVRAHSPTLRPSARAFPYSDTCSAGEERLHENVFRCKHVPAKSGQSSVILLQPSGSGLGSRPPTDTRRSQQTSRRPRTLQKTKTNGPPHRLAEGRASICSLPKGSSVCCLRQPTYVTTHEPPPYTKRDHPPARGSRLRTAGLTLPAGRHPRKRHAHDRNNRVRMRGGRLDPSRYVPNFTPEANLGDRPPSF